MIPNDIIVGQKYYHKSFKGTVYLGIGSYNTILDTYTDRNLVIIKDPNHQKYGRIVVSFMKNPNFWNGFYTRQTSNTAHHD